MNRRSFMGLFAAAGVSAPTAATAALQSSDDADLAIADVDPYFLESGDLDSASQAGIEDLVGFQERTIAGEPAVQPRGRPRLAPTYRLLNWKGELNGQGTFQGPLSLSPSLPLASAYQFNAQILGFHGARDDWGRGNARGTLSIEFRTRLDTEPMTWLFAQQFDIGAEGQSTLSLEYVGQRGGARDPIVTDDSNIDLRIQLLRHRKGAKLLRKILQLFSFVVGLPAGGITGATATLAQALPVIRVPRLLREGVAFSQALLGGLTKELPIWRSGFTTYALAEGGSRLALSPGLWVIIDESREVDLRGVQLRDLGGSVGLVRNEKIIDANYLIIAIDASQAQLSGYGRVVDAPTDSWIDKGLPIDESTR
ncbi:MAG: hypothetical protein K0U72_01575 [Gammaproteobacteria bacterium]|nr:hypothetical protein [Gammaproteobacteria bacterium]